jgi:hypothetical protein
MQRNQADTKFHYEDDQSWTQLSLSLGVRARIPAQPAQAMANVRTTMGLIAGLLLVWVAIVDA